MTNVKITRKAIEKALKIMVATAPNFLAFTKYYAEYGEKLAAENTNFIVIWDDNDIFEIFNTRSNKSSFVDFSAELSKMD